MKADRSRDELSSYTRIASLRQYLDLFLLHWRSTKDRAGAAYEFFQLCNDKFCQATSTTLADKRVLEVGCGQRYPVSLLFHSKGIAAVGIDTDPVQPGFKKYRVMLRTGHAERCFRTFVRSILFDRYFYHRLRLASNIHLTKRGIDLRTEDITRRTSFRDEEFDFVISNNVFEHIADVPAAINEIHRILKPAGLCLIKIHLFPSLSGGHSFHPATPSWDHLRGNTFPSHSYLNGLRESDYREAFGKRMKIIDWITVGWEDSRYLTRDIEEELKPRYSRDDLLKRSIAVLAGKNG